MNCSSKLPVHNTECQPGVGTTINKIRVTTPESYAEIKNVSLKTVYNWINSGKVQTTKQFKKLLIVV